MFTIFVLFFSIFTPLPIFLASFFLIHQQKFPGQKSLGGGTLPPCPPPVTSLPASTFWEAKERGARKFFKGQKCKQCDLSEQTLVFLCWNCQIRAKFNTFESICGKTREGARKYYGVQMLPWSHVHWAHFNRKWRHFCLNSGVWYKPKYSTELAPHVHVSLQPGQSPH